ncbi:MADCA protein, partial [Turnix velox]|nr:MADCA protein [Turnix velox]
LVVAPHPSTPNFSSSPGRPTEKLVVMPQQPLVKYGGSVSLNCSLDCKGGTVQWKGLDTNLGGITSFPTHSILQVSKATVATEGTKICHGTCHGVFYQHAVYLKVYALPDVLQLDVDPHGVKPGQATTLQCSAQGVYPPLGLVLTWYRGDQKLEETDLDVTETEEELFDIVSTLQVAGKDLVEGLELRCEVTLSIGQETFSRVASVVVRSGVVAPTETPSTAWSMTTTGLSSELSDPSHDLSTSMTTTSQEPNLEPDATTREPSAPQDIISSSPTGHLDTIMPSVSTTTSSPVQRSASDNISWDVAPPEKVTRSPLGTAATCSMKIWSLPPNGTRGRALSIKCQAWCSTENVTVRWLRTPVDLEEYQEEVVGSWSTLWLENAGPQHQGDYQCILLGHHSQVVTLELRVMDDPASSSPVIATGTTFSLLGLLVTGVVSRRLWKKFRSQYDFS